MEELDTLNEELTATLLEVFNEIDSDEYNEISIKQPSCEKALPTFLLEEHESDLNAALNTKKTIDVKKKSKYTSSTKLLKENSLIHRDIDISENEDESPEDENKTTKWITSDITLKNNPGVNRSYYFDGTPKNGKKWSEPQIPQEKSNKIVPKADLPKNIVKDVLVDPVFFMRIVTPKVSTSMLKERMVGREAVLPDRIKQYLERTDLKVTNWVTGGAIIGKCVTKSQKGNPYCIWNLSDLRGDIKVISVYLFGGAYKEFWKLPLGVVVGILNPSQLPNKTSKAEATLKVDHSDKIMIFGNSKDYGTCRSKKNNGENCTATINKSTCEYCIYHVKQVYDKASRRPELQSNFTGRGLVNLRNKVLGKNEVFYGGKLYSAVTGKQTSLRVENKCDKLRMLPAVTDSTKTKKDQELLQRLSSISKNKSNDAERTPESKMTHSSLLATQKYTQVDVKPKTEKMIDLDCPITKKQVLKARANALEFIRQNGPLKKPEDKKQKRTPEQISALKRRLESEELQSKRMKTSDDTKKSPKSLLEQKKERSGITEKFLKLMNAEAQNVELLRAAENEERDKYFNRLEVKEKMEEKMASTFKVDCKAVRCLKCNYKSFTASELCKTEKHPLKVVNAIKRFWKCGDCSARTVCLELVPLHSCKVCGSSKWERTSMLPEKKTSQQTLSIRGHEEKFVGSVVRNPNINLLVPDEDS